MKETVSRHRFIDVFMKIRPDNFSRSGLHALYDYITDLEDDIGEEIEFDVIALCCDFSEYENLQAVSEAFEKDFMKTEDIRDYTQVIEIEDSERIIIQDF